MPANFMRYHVLLDAAERSVELAQQNAREIIAVIDGRQVQADAVTVSPSLYSLIIDGHSFDAQVRETPEGFLVHIAGREVRVAISDPRAWQRLRAGKLELAGRQQVSAPMPGKIVRILISAGEQVKAGQGLMVVEAMKMQNEIRSPKSGVVERILCTEGQSVTVGEILAVIA